MNAYQRRKFRRAALRVVTDFQGKLVRRKANPYQNETLEVRGFKVSIQGSSFHYCEPRIDNPFGGYSEMEIAVFDKAGDWCVLTDHEEKEFGTNFEKYESMSTSVSGYTGVEGIQNLLNAIAIGEVQPMKLSDYFEVQKADREIEACISGMDVM